MNNNNTYQSIVEAVKQYCILVSTSKGQNISDLVRLIHQMSLHFWTDSHNQGQNQKNCSTCAYLNTYPHDNSIIKNYVCQCSIFRHFKDHLTVKDANCPYCKFIPQKLEEQYNIYNHLLSCKGCGKQIDNSKPQLIHIMKCQGCAACSSFPQLNDQEKQQLCTLFITIYSSYSRSNNNKMNNNNNNNQMNNNNNNINNNQMNNNTNQMNNNINNNQMNNNQMNGSMQLNMNTVNTPSNVMNTNMNQMNNNNNINQMNNNNNINQMNNNNNINQMNTNTNMNQMNNNNINQMNTNTNMNQMNNNINQMNNNNTNTNSVPPYSYNSQTYTNNNTNTNTNNTSMMINPISVYPQNNQVNSQDMSYINTSTPSIASNTPIITSPYTSTINTTPSLSTPAIRTRASSVSSHRSTNSTHNSQYINKNTYINNSTMMNNTNNNTNNMNYNNSTINRVTTTNNQQAININSSIPNTNTNNNMNQMNNTNNTIMNNNTSNTSDLINSRIQGNIQSTNSVNDPRNYPYYPNTTTNNTNSINNTTINNSVYPKIVSPSSSSTSSSMIKPNQVYGFNTMKGSSYPSNYISNSTTISTYPAMKTKTNTVKKRTPSNTITGIINQNIGSNNNNNNNNNTMGNTNNTVISNNNNNNQNNNNNNQNNNNQNNNQNNNITGKRSKNTTRIEKEDKEETLPISRSTVILSKDIKKETNENKYVGYISLFSKQYENNNSLTGEVSTLEKRLSNDTDFVSRRSQYSVDYRESKKWDRICILYGETIKSIYIKYSKSYNIGVSEKALITLTEGIRQYIRHVVERAYDYTKQRRNIYPLSRTLSLNSMNTYNDFITLWMKEEEQKQQKLIDINKDKDNNNLVNNKDKDNNNNNNNTNNNNILKDSSLLTSPTRSIKNENQGKRPSLLNDDALSVTEITIDTPVIKSPPINRKNSTINNHINIHPKERETNDIYEYKEQSMSKDNISTLEKAMGNNEITAIIAEDLRSVLEDSPFTICSSQHYNTIYTHVTKAANDALDIKKN
ncbi:hypothetical protein WA158_006665 [Blastocystis sp. Blastoise]